MRIFQAFASVAFLLTIDCSVQSAKSGHLLGGEKCIWGPSYWCSGLRQSSRCQATRHCIEQVWTSNPFPEDDDDICSVCKNMVHEARNQLQSNMTQDELKEVFDGSCALIPIKIIGDECKNLVDEFVPELVETLSSEMNPDTVCTVAGLCNSKRIDKMLAKLFAYHHKLQRQESDCDVCKEQAKKLSVQIFNADKDLVLDKLFELCGYAGTFADSCRDILQQDFEDIYYVLTHLYEEGLCDLSGMCPSSTFQSSIQVYQEGESQQCQFCQNFILKWIETWTSGMNEVEFKQVLDAVVCHKMKPEQVQHCLHLVDDYYIPWFNYILHESNPKSACQLMGLCKSRGGNDHFLAASSNDAPILVQEEPPVNNVSEKSNGLFSPFNQLENNDDEYCEVCKYAMNTLYQILENKDDQNEVKNALESLCRLMPSSIQDKCEEYVDAYAEKIIELVLASLTPDEICQELGLCRKKEEKCILCEYILSTLDEILEEDSTEDEVRQSLDKVCQYFPDTLNHRCTNFVNQYSGLIIDFLTHQITSDQVCQQIGLCLEQPKIVENDLIVQDDSRPYCTLCEYAIGQVDNLITDKKNEQEIKNVLDTICYELSNPVQKECMKMVDQYTDEIINMFVNDFTPQEVCARLKLCNQIKEETEMSNSVSRFYNEEFNQGVGPMCVLCEFAMHILEKEIITNRTLDMVEHAVEMICSYMPNVIADNCIDFVQEYGDKIIDLIVRLEMNPEQVCEALTLCLSGQPLLDTDQRCSLGPSFWCQSRIHAKSCGEIQHCEEYVWN